jgi:hypothetical protein
MVWRSTTIIKGESEHFCDDLAGDGGRDTLQYNGKLALNVSQHGESKRAVWRS